MTEKDPREIKIEALQAKSQDTHKALTEVSSIITDKFIDNPMVQLMGKLMLGSDKKKTTNPDGSVVESDWSMGDIFAHMHEMDEEAEKGVRQTLLEDLVKGLEAQRKFLAKTESPLKVASALNTNLVACLLERILASDEKIANPYPASRVSEAFWEAEALEVIRRTTLEPTQILLDGWGRSGIRSIPEYEEEGFWEMRKELLTDEMRRHPGGRTVYSIEMQPTS